MEDSGNELGVARGSSGRPPRIADLSTEWGYQDCYGPLATRK
jgi:hypothetical protein